jgi:hypothetical protein
MYSSIASEQGLRTVFIPGQRDVVSKLSHRLIFPEAYGRTELARNILPICFCHTE